MEETYVSIPLPTGGTQTGEGTRSISGKETRTGHKEHNFWLQATPEPYKRLDLLSQLQPLLKPLSNNKHLTRLLNASFQFFQYTQHTSCKTQNLGLRSKEEKPRDPITQPSRCNMQEGLLSVAQAGDSDLLGGRAHRTANWANFICSMLHTGYKVIGYMFAKQSYWYKLRGLLFKFKAILLVQTARAFVQI